MLFNLAERTLARHAIGIGGKLAHRFDISPQPGKAVGGALLAIEQPVDDMALDHDPRADLLHGIG